MSDLDDLLPGDATTTPEDTWAALRERITILSERAWENRNTWPSVLAWLRNFNGRSGFDPEVEQLHALFLLSQFLFIGGAETRVLLQAVFRDLFMVPLIQEVRRDLGGSRDCQAVAQGVHAALARTRFLGVGNPSESGVHLLYYFRQENALPKDLFLDPAAMFTTTVTPDGVTSRQIADANINRYVFVDDVCGSGDTAIKYSRNVLTELASLLPDVKLHYLSMFATKAGMERVRRYTRFGENSAAVFELDETYQCLSERSRILHAKPAHIDPATLAKVALTYGALICPAHPGGFDDNQLLIGFQHNTPDNTLPIIWGEGSLGMPWTPAFKRYPKLI
ncbi:hypothetical protein ACFOON_07985 [Novosphingobium piscinae]|uniref:PRTase-CE domain-containing protein n=1 Tax=Novosphingobium piscinae TaxID=1507448 RepID=A0A7X1FYI5_9SPHN|nr:hypothetical protein [Novosphingobium piscinae]MBC2669234.1 hypothetical protein [Novosphingobium piscinae]